ncbi:MAG: UDP-3-O-(3-hydroxymyristoyl)glucosamine N-acyltransferase [Gemmatimonadales bacterium]|nr:UDP-3-O-(3-hydroxymyristoyl)glucosamine N-acyltransferase [Gemmatimonadales bacterium]
MPSLRLSEVAALVGGELVDDRDPLINGVSGIDEAGHGDLTFVTSRKFIAKLEKCEASGVIIGTEDEVDLPAVRVAEPYRAFAAVLVRFQAEDDRVFPRGIHSSAVVDEKAQVADDVALGPFCFVGSGAKIGSGTRLGPHVVVGPDVELGRDCRLYAHVGLREGCRVGDRVVLHLGASIGTDGFGYLPSEQGLLKIPQVGIVVLEDDVEIGAGVCIDRATTGQTRIGSGTKIDNLVQVGHNVHLGRNCALSAQCGLSGSVVVGDRVTMGGQVGISHQVEIGSDAKLGGKTGATRSLIGGKEYFGVPALEAKESFRILSALRKLPALLRRVALLESRLPDQGRKKEQE